MNIVSAGILLYRDSDFVNDPEVFLIRANHVDKGRELWGVPKGRTETGETIFETAQREFFEETGMRAPVTYYQVLPPFYTSYGKTIHIFTAPVTQEETIVWTKENVKYTSGKRNGKLEYYQETSDGQWFKLSEAYHKIGRGQKGILDFFAEHYKTRSVTRR